MTTQAFYNEIISFSIIAVVVSLLALLTLKMEKRYKDKQ